MVECMWQYVQLVFYTPIMLCIWIRSLSISKTWFPKDTNLFKKTIVNRFGAKSHWILIILVMLHFFYYLLVLNKSNFFKHTRHQVKHRHCFFNFCLNYILDDKWWKVKRDVSCWNMTYLNLMRISTRLYESRRVFMITLVRGVHFLYFRRTFPSFQSVKYETKHEGTLHCPNILFPQK